jgi:hypothetical protein
MTLYPVLFNQTLPRLRRSGARGGRADAPNRQRVDGSLAPPISQTLPSETTAQAIAILEAKFPWLCQFDQRSPHR